MWKHEENAFKKRRFVRIVTYTIEKMKRQRITPRHTGGTTDGIASDASRRWRDENGRKDHGFCSANTHGGPAPPTCAACADLQRSRATTKDRGYQIRRIILGSFQYVYNTTWGSVSYQQQKRRAMQTLPTHKKKIAGRRDLSVRNDLKNAISSKIR